MEQQLQNLTLAYAPKERANKPRKLKNDITREMIDDYEAEIDRERTFQPSSLIPVLEKPNLVPAFTETDLIDIQRKIGGMGEEIGEIEQEIPLIFETMRREEEFYNNFISDIDNELQTATGDRKNRLVLERRRSVDKFRKRSEEAQRLIGELEGRKRGLEARIASSQKAYQENAETVQQNAGELERVRKANQASLKNVEDEIRILNQGFSINQQAGESEEDYLKRIESMKDTKYSVGTQADAEVYNFKMLKKKLSSILSMPDHKLTKVLKLLEKDTLLYEANKKFPLVRARIEKVLGLKSSPDETTLYNVITEALQGIEKEEEVTPDTSDKQALMKLTVKQLKEIWFETTGTKTPKANGKPLTRKQDIVDEIFRLQALRPNLATAPRFSDELAINLKVKAGEVSARNTPTTSPIPDTPQRGRPLEKPSSSEKKRKPRATKAEMEERRKALADRKAALDERAVGVLTNLRPFERARSASRDPFGRSSSVESTGSFKSVGEGMQKLIGFGAIKISPAQLQLYDVLRVREPSKHSIRGLPDTRVSKDMVYILSKVMNGQSPSATELNALSPKERSMYDAVIFKAKLHTQVPHTADMSIADLKRRLSLLEGEVQAGNSNKDIKKELNSVIRQLIELRAISTQNGRNYLKQI